MFSQACVSHSVRGGGVVCLRVQRGMLTPLDTHAHTHTHTHTHTPQTTGQQAGGTNPTGMLSCIYNVISAQTDTQNSRDKIVTINYPYKVHPQDNVSMGEGSSQDDLGHVKRYLYGPPTKLQKGNAFSPICLPTGVVVSMWPLPTWGPRGAYSNLFTWTSPYRDLPPPPINQSNLFESGLLTFMWKTFLFLFS